MKLIFHNTPDEIKNIQTLLKSLDKDKEYILQVKKYYRNRSIMENRYYWGVIIKLLSDYTGMFPDELHEALKHKFLLNGTTIKNGEELKFAKSTASLTTAEFEEYCRNIRTWASTDLNVFIPLPNEDINYNT